MRMIYRRTDKVPIKAHGLIKDKEAVITTFNQKDLDIQTKINRGGAEDYLCTNMHQENYLHQEVTDGISMESESMHEYLSSSYYDMVARPAIEGIKIYRRIFIKKRMI